MVLKRLVQSNAGKQQPRWDCKPAQPASNQCSFHSRGWLPSLVQEKPLEG